MNEDKQLDKYELALEEKIKILQECQKNKSHNTCMDCDSVFDCQLRKEYVLAVYESMNKGSGGGFEF